MDLVAIHRGDGEVGRALGRDIDKAVTQPFSVRRIAGDRCSQHHPKGVEGFGQFIVGELRRQVRNKNVTPETTRSHPPSPSVVGSESYWGNMSGNVPAGKCSLLHWCIAAWQHCMKHRVRFPHCSRSLSYGESACM